MRILAKSSMNLYLYLQKTDPLKSHLTFIILANVYLVLIRHINSPQIEAFSNRNEFFRAFLFY